MAGRLQGKRVFITAAGQGIGRAAALAMVAEGATVMATDLQASLLAGLEASAGIRVAALDVTDSAAVRAAAEAFGTPDVLFNCAGYVHQGDLLHCDEADWDRSFDINVKSMYRTCRAFLPGMLAAGAGSIINMASIASSVRGLPNRLAYGSSKAAVVGFTKALAADTVTHGIRVNAVAPGTVETPSLQDRINAFADPTEARKAFIARQPMGRIATVDDITPVIVFLASDESRFATGCVYSVDGGMTI